MAKAKQAPLKVLYHTFICDDNCGEADGFYEINRGKLEFVTGWFCDDATWRSEYMSGLLSHLGAEVKSLPGKYQEQASLLLAREYGLIPDEESEGEGERESAELYYRKGSSDKVYDLSVFENDEGWCVEAVYGRRKGSLRVECKCEGADYATAKKLYDKVLNEKLKKGYKYA